MEDNAPIISEQHSSKVMFVLIYILIFTLFLQFYPPQQMIAQDEPNVFIQPQIDSPVIITDVDSLLKENNVLTESVKSEAQRGKQLAKIAEKESKKKIN